MGVDVIKSGLMSSNDSVQVCKELSELTMEDVFDDIKSATNLIGSLLMNCRVYEEMRENTFKLEVEPFQLVSLFNRVKDTVKFRVKSVTINLQVDTDLPEYVIGNERLLAFFVLHVVLGCARRSKSSNTVHIAVKKGPEVNASYHNRFPLSIEVTDTGDRLNETERACMFTAFSKLDVSDELKDKVCSFIDLV